MTTPFLREDLRHDEGLMLHAYPDPLTGGDPWTIGYGHTGPDVHQGLVWTQEQADDALERDIEKVCHDLDAKLNWWRLLEDLRQDVLANMAFNTGVDGLLKFHRMLDAVSTGNFAKAADQMLESLWAKQVKGRAQRLAQQMLTGEHA